MSSIAYVTDSNMIEYHRLCGNRRFNFWRLSSRTAFSDFGKGDLLFFYARGRHHRRRGFVGYAHFESARRLSLKQMWKEYGSLNGFETREDLEEAIQRASRDGVIPEKMSCLLLKDAVFFNEPVFPKDVGLEVTEKLESYMYPDRMHSDMTVRILRRARRAGIDTWASSQTSEPEYLFELDEIREILAMIRKEMGRDPWSAEEKRKARKLAAPLLEKEGFELIRGSIADLLKAGEDGTVIALPFAASSSNETERIKDLLGKITWYRTRCREYGLPGKDLSFQVLCQEKEGRKEFLLEAVKHV